MATGVTSRLIIHSVRGIPRVNFVVHPKVARTLVAIPHLKYRGHWLIGYYDPYSLTVQLCELTVKGIPVLTLLYVHMVTPGDTREVLMSASGGFLGLAEEVFPYPQSWKFPGIVGNIATATVRQITARLTIAQTEPPTCMTSWEDRVRLPID